MGHPWPSHHMACRCTCSCHHHSRRHQARLRLWTQSDRPRVFSDSPAYFAGPSDPAQARTRITQVTPYMARSFGYNPGQFGPIVDRPVSYAGLFEYVADHPVPYVGPSRYVMDRPTYFAGPSDSTRVHAQTDQVVPYMTESS
jgi:tartrate dehydratase beta subunit/fumarate hydratase class I family protein